MYPEDGCKALVQAPGEDVCDAPGRVPVPERIPDAGHGPIRGGIVEQQRGFLHDARRIRADDLSRPGLDHFGTLRQLSQYENGLVE